MSARHRLGGEPELGKETPPLRPACAPAMDFYGHPDPLNEREGRYDLGDRGPIEVFVCCQCRESISRVRRG